MPVDPTNLPFLRGAPYREVSPAVSQDAPTVPAAAGGAVDATLKAESILLEEFNQASVMAYQAMEGAPTSSTSTSWRQACWPRGSASW